VSDYNTVKPLWLKTLNGEYIVYAIVYKIVVRMLYYCNSIIKLQLIEQISKIFVLISKYME